ncbi:hypothetical protein FRC06_007476, partial [Ceratobasidium sp. 370]
LVGSLRGLAYIHSFSIVHGDLKGLNILVAGDGTPKICGFGHSPFTDNSAQPVVSGLSSKFHSTTRYMSPELFTDPKSKPTLASDIWAFGCVALEIPSQPRPHHVITNEHRVTLAIKSGRTPSAKPDYPYAASWLTDTLWNIIKKCWHPHQLSRPSSISLLSAINDLIELGELNPSTSTPLRSAKDLSEEPLDWPEKVEDLAWKLVKFDKKKILVQRMADVWRYSQDDLPKVVSSSKPSVSQIFAVKVLRAPGGLGSGDITVDPFQQALRRVVWERLSINHQHIIQLLGIDTSYGRYPGLVMEYCGGGNLEDVLESAALDDDHFPVRCMIQILTGLEFLHNLPSPLAHGDLTPVCDALPDSKGTLKLTLVSFARLSTRYLSPELIAKDDGSWPTPHADMWSFGCVTCWMYVKIDPYPDCRLEYKVISNIIDGLPPYSVAHLSRIGPLGGSHLMPSAPWITNGTLAAILRCWNQDGNRRPTATACLNDLAELLDDAGRKIVPVSPDMRNLTGKVTTPDHPRKKILGHCRGIWSYIADEFSITEERNLLSFIIGGGGTVFILLDSCAARLNVKGIRLAPRARSGDLLDSAKQPLASGVNIARGRPAPLSLHTPSAPQLASTFDFVLPRTNLDYEWLTSPTDLEHDDFAVPSASSVSYTPQASTTRTLTVQGLENLDIPTDIRDFNFEMDVDERDARNVVLAVSNPGSAASSDASSLSSPSSTSISPLDSAWPEPSVDSTMAMLGGDYMSYDYDSDIFATPPLCRNLMYVPECYGKT